MLACLLLVATCNWGEFIVQVASIVELYVSLPAAIALGEVCEFPTDHPIQDLESGQTVLTEPMINNLVYIYTDNFGDCHGCVRSIKFCYRPGSGQSEDLMTIKIINNGNQMIASRMVTVNPDNDRTNCAERFSLIHTDCCVEQMLTEPLFVSSRTWHYALRITNPTSSLLRHQTETVDGDLENLGGQSVLDSVYKPLFYFTIDPSDSRLSQHY